MLLKAASGSLRNGVTGLDVNGQRKYSINVHALRNGNLLLYSIPDTCTRLADTLYGVTTMMSPCSSGRGGRATDVPSASAVAASVF